MSEVISFIDDKIAEHTKQANKHRANAESYEKFSQNERQAESLLHEAISDLERSKAALEGVKE